MTDAQNASLRADGRKREPPDGAAGESRTLDLSLTKGVLYH